MVAFKSNKTISTGQVGSYISAHFHSADGPNGKNNACKSCSVTFGCRSFTISDTCGLELLFFSMDSPLMSQPSLHFRISLKFETASYIARLSLGLAKTLIVIFWAHVMHIGLPMSSKKIRASRAFF